jgi:hypothetical protein
MVIVEQLLRKRRGSSNRRPAFGHCSKVAIPATKNRPEGWLFRSESPRNSDNSKSRPCFPAVSDEADAGEAKDHHCQAEASGMAETAEMDPLKTFPFGGVEVARNSRK